MTFALPSLWTFAPLSRLVAPPHLTCAAAPFKIYISVLGTLLKITGNFTKFTYLAEDEYPDTVTNVIRNKILKR